MVYTEIATLCSVNLPSAGNVTKNGTFAVTTGEINVGKLISSNASSNEDKVTASDTYGIICDATEDMTNTGGTIPCPTDIVGTCEMYDVTESTGTEWIP